jgi:hypothetical protein
MSWRLSSDIRLENDRIQGPDAERQMRTAAEILKRFDTQPGVILADEVGMGKTFVALAVAVSVVQATNYRHPVVVMIPSTVREKWPREWDVFRSECVRKQLRVRAPAETVIRGAQFLKLLDDPAARRNHLIFLTHGALTNSLTDPYIRLAIVRQALTRRRSLVSRQTAIARWSDRLFGRQLRDEGLTLELLRVHPSRWKTVIEGWRGVELDDDPIPKAVLRALKRVDIRDLTDALAEVPVRSSPHIGKRLEKVRASLGPALRDVWEDVLHSLDLRLPLLILDEAHHLKNRWTRLASLFANEAEEDLEVLRGPLGGVFDRMLFLTATPFQLGHHELLEVLHRFEGVRWPTQAGRREYQDQLGDLGRALDATQTAALRFDRAWGQIEPADVARLQGEWWQEASPEFPDGVRQALLHANEVGERCRQAEKLLRPWVIRHARPDRDARRSTMAGGAIRNDDRNGVRGLQVEGSAVLPFLLAARAQALVAIRGSADDMRARAYFAEGLASSFEAYRQTRLRQNSGEILDDDVMDGDAPAPDSELDWYLQHLDAALPSTDRGVWGDHPKIAATVNRAVELWKSGEKVVVFCFYIETGRALRRHVSRSLEDEFVRIGAQRLGLESRDREKVLEELRLLSERFFDPKSPVRKEAEGSLERILSREGLTDEVLERAIDVSLRFLRTRSFLLRHMDIGATDKRDALRAAFETEDSSGLTLGQKMAGFAAFLRERVDSEREELLVALEAMNTGEIAAVTEDFFDVSERSQADRKRRESLLPNVRLANGEVQRDTRRRLMLAFNTPFFPEILIASSVMAEGVDLHLNCRHVIHHDLDWNPSVLEQRTGRLDRIGSHSERSGQPIVVYEPFLEATQDEKQYRVVKDRERWFNVIMGERMALDEASTDRLASRVPLPNELAKSLSMRLEVVRAG